MNNHLFLDLEDFDTSNLKHYFLNSVLPRFWDKIQLNFCSFVHDTTKDSEVEKLSNFLQTKYGISPIVAYSFFYLKDHKHPIHIDGYMKDGSYFIRNANLNLVLSGHEGCKMRFFNSGTENILPKNGVLFCDPEKVTFLNEFETTEQWTLVRVNIPHDVINENENNVRIVISFKFKDNPSFEHLETLFNGRS
jgi:hypothetical protein